MNRAAFHQSVQHLGIARALAALAYHTFQRTLPFQILKVMQVTLNDLSGELVPDLSHCSIELRSAQEMLNIFPDGALDLSPEFLNEALEREDECLAIFLDNKLASYGWYAHRKAPFSPHLTVTFDPEWVYMYKGFTAPEHRGKRLHALGKIRALKHFTPRGFKGLVSYVELVNYPSQISNYRLGYRDTGFVVIVGDPRAPWIFHSPSCRATGLTISPNSSGGAAPSRYPGSG